MKEWQELLEYIDYYVYLDDEEGIVIKQGTESDKALAAYERGLSILRKKDDMECCLGYYSASYNETEKWEYDVALDSIRQVKPAYRKALCDSPHISDYYFGLAMWIRNTYIHPVKKFNPCDADNVSADIMYKIFSIVNPVYDYRNEQLVSYYNDNEMSKLGKMYRKCQPAVFDEIENKLVLGKYASSNTAVHELKCKLREVCNPAVNHRDKCCSD